LAIDAARRWSQVLPLGCREVETDGVGDPVEGEPLDDAGEAEAVVAVEVRDEDARDRRRGGTDERHLALCSFAGVEQEALVVPAEQVAVDVARSRRDLRGGP
jgi:hypothetical protein